MRVEGRFRWPALLHTLFVYLVAKYGILLYVLRILIEFFTSAVKTDNS
jgi:hypothetical protein